MFEADIECGGFLFTRDFDSGNLGHVEQVPKEDVVSGVNFKTNANETPDYEFNIWTRPDCIGTEFENGNRTWFYFGIKSAPPSVLVKLNLVNLNRQSKMYSQGMAPVTKMIPGRSQWDRIKDKPIYFSNDNIFTLSFKFRTPENVMAVTYFAFTYPYTYMELQTALSAIDARVPLSDIGSEDDIYYCRECVCYSLEKRRVDLLTITSRHGITNKREDKLKNLFPEDNERPYKFSNKKVIFISARVHPGETPSSFVFNGFLNMITNRNDPVAISLRKIYVFKLIPFMNPDGVAKGHYRTDTRGVNLNRVYQSPSFELHPSVFAARALIRYYHFGFEKYDNVYDSIENNPENQTLAYPKQDQENVNLNEFNMKRKMIGNSKIGTGWQNYSNGRYRSPSLDSNTISRIPRMKLAIDSEDDTSCSMSTNNTTLAEQVEELNINQSSVDGFNNNLNDDCAVDNIISKSNHLLTSNPIETPNLSANANLAYDDDDDVITKNSLKNQISFKANQIKMEPESSGESKTDSKSLSMSDCFKLIKPWCKKCLNSVSNLESQMPGISQMLPNLCNNDSTMTATVLCVNCHSPLDKKLLDTNTEVKNQNNSKLSVSKESKIKSNLSLSPDVNKNNMKTRANNDRKSPRKKSKSFSLYGRSLQKEKESNLFLYIDLHGHASKKGIFMYGNHFDEIDNSVECMLLPRIMSLNNMHFHFSSCNFTERNMYLKDRRDGMSREGSGRVAVLKATGLMRSYTLECNYNTGRIVNVLPPTARESLPAGSPPAPTPAVPPKYNPHLFEEVGKSLASSILDLTGHHPNSRIPASEHRNIHGIRDWLRLHSRHIKPSQIIAARQSTSAYTPRPIPPRSARSHVRLSKQQSFVDPERKENLAGPGYQGDTSITPPRIGLSTASRASSTTLKLLPIRLRGDQPLTAKPPRNLSLISIKKSVVPKHPSTFKPPSRNRSPTPKIRFNTKQKISEEGDLVKGSLRSLMESNRANPSKQPPFKTKLLKSNFKGHKDAAIQKPSGETATTSVPHRKAKIRSKDSLYQKQPVQFSSKPLTKRLKMSQYIKYSDNAKEKYRIRKPSTSKGAVDAEPVSGSVSSSGEDVLSWDAVCGPNMAAGSSGTSGNTQTTAKCPKRATYKSRRPALHHLPPTTPDLENRRQKFV